ncbi:MAG: TonB-dependent receptor [Bryobacteraceae bacterium]
MRLLGVLVCLSLAGLAQPPGEIRLQVRDSSGAGMLASGKVRGPGLDRAFETGATGAFRLSGLAAGHYRIDVSKPGFRPETVEADLDAGSVVERTVTLAVGESSFGVDVVAATPLAGADRDRSEIPSPVQAATQRDINASGALDFSDFLNRRMNGVFLNEIQGNPYQADLNYRGYTASPLLGTPQGLSVYVDGVRFNQPFGDVVSWDLIPLAAISEMALMPGSNPVFGLNTLGGSLAVVTKDGHSNPGAQLSLMGGSFGRKNAELEYGGATQRGWSWFGASNLFFEDGWRDNSPSSVRQFFGRAGWTGGKTSVNLGAAYANNALIGNGLNERRFLARDWSGIYTKPDITANRSPFLNLSLRHTASNAWSLSGNAYYRHIRTATLNADLNEDSFDQAVYQPSAADIRALTAAGYAGFPLSGATAANTPFPSWRCIAQSLQRDEPAEKCNGLINRSSSSQDNFGASGQVSHFASIHGNRNQLTAGAAYDRSRLGFHQLTQLGYLTPDRGVIGVHSFFDGVTGGNVDGEPIDTRVNLHGLVHTGSVYATDTVSIASAWTVTLSGRFNRTTVENFDRIAPTPGPESLTARHLFQRFNPAVGVTFRAAASLQAYASYSEGNRAPTSIELGCADPGLPCKLPNSLAGDPPLRQVVSRTIEAGVRGRPEGKLDWTLGWFRGDNSDDILFVASGQTGFGYFKNFGHTRRQGIEADLRAPLGRLIVGGGYTLLDATFRSRDFVRGASNSSQDSGGAIGIVPGNRIPLTPRHMVKSYAELRVSEKLAFDLGAMAHGSMYARGNENNLHRPAQYFADRGTAPGYVLANFGGRYQIHRRVQLVVQVNNLFDRRYYTAAQLGVSGLTDARAFIARPFPAVGGVFPLQHTTFFAPGTPRGIQGGLRLKL